MKRSGTIQNWNPAKQCGQIIARDVNPPERFFLFASRVISGPEPYLNAGVLFEPDSRPTLPGKLPFALHIEVLGDAEGGK